MSPTVWLVRWAYSPSDHGIEGVFATEGLARRFLASKGTIEENEYEYICEDDSIQKCVVVSASDEHTTYDIEEWEVEEVEEAEGPEG